MRVAMDPQAQEIRFELFAEFEDISKIDDAFNAFQSASSLSFNGGLAAEAMPIGAAESPTKVNYNFKGNTFYRITEITDQDLFQKSVDGLASSETFLSGSTYTFKYHFPRKVQRVKVEDATFSMDGKTMIYEVSFLDMTKTPESVRLEVELEV